MGFHIYIKQVIDKPLLTPEAEKQADKNYIYFHSVAEFIPGDFSKLEDLFTDKLCELFGCEGFFLKECRHEENKLPFERVARTDEVFCRKTDFSDYLQRVTTPEIAAVLLDFFVEGQHVASIG